MASFNGRVGRGICPTENTYAPLEYQQLIYCPITPSFCTTPSKMNLQKVSECHYQRPHVYTELSSLPSPIGKSVQQEFLSGQ